METVREESAKAKITLPNFLKGRWLWAFAGVVALVFLLLAPGAFFHKGQTKEQDQASQTDEKRLVFSERELKKAIESSLKQVRETRPKSRQPVTRNRNYATEIAVFIHEEKEPKAMQSTARGVSKKLGLPPGTRVKAFLSGTVFSFNVAAPVIAVVSEDVVWKGEVAIPKESKFLGEAGVLKSLNRINVFFDELVFPDGRTVRVHAMALSEDGSAGIKGRVRKHRELKILKAIAEAAVAGGSLFLGGVTRDPFSYEDQLRLNLAQNLTQEARRDLREVKVDKSITAESFTPVQIILLDGI